MEFKQLKKLLSGLTLTADVMSIFDIALRTLMIVVVFQCAAIALCCTLKSNGN